MKYLLLSLSLLVLPSMAFAHDGTHSEPAWYLSVSIPLLILVAILAAGVLWYGLLSHRFKLMTIPAGVALALVAIIGIQQVTALPTAVSQAVAADLKNVPMTLYRVEGCSCCTGYARELGETGADVTVETITNEEMTEIKNKYGIQDDQASCHTTIVGNYAVEGHVPFAALSRLVSEKPDITGITLPGMPVGTPGMPGKQTETYTVNTLNNELFWQSS